MSLQQKIDRITDILRRDDGISGAMHYTEQTSWVLFLKFLDDYETEKEDEAVLSGKDYQPGVSCHHCICKHSPEQRQRYAERERQIELAQRRGEEHLGHPVQATIKQRRQRKLAFKKSQRDSLRHKP